MLLGAIADDFTGASDLANTLARNGMATTLFVGVPDGNVAPAEAGVVALKTRSIAPAEAVRQSLDALAWLRRQGAGQILFKYCSTFDSTPEGNIGPVAEALSAALGAGVAVVCPVFPATGRTLYQGHLFVGDRLLNESGMEKHPLTPMTDPDIRRWLRRQTKGEVGLVPYAIVRQGGEAIRAALAEIDKSAKLAVVDAVTDDDLKAIGAAIADARLITGGSGIAVGLPDNFRKAGKLGTGDVAYSGIVSPGVALSGSCSRASLAQLARHLEGHPGFALRPDAVMAGEVTVAAARDFVLAHAEEAPIVYSSAEPEAVKAAQARFGREAVAGAIESFFGALAAELVAAGVTRIAVGGGETSGAVVAALALQQLAIGPEIDPGVPALAGKAEEKPIRLALKSGNFGAPDFYAKALAIMGVSR
ncbi:MULTISPECIES: 3-oxo-tetronate kinase [unclassified Chelatococcus]|uniref:3-oxo-tetronate kinase n=1 Tax=unclassified Chelatococcus TaxID=2638111 RepID=UPI001BCBDDB1|nr:MULTISPECIES: 3-oxo-tetronate kinase [unclassified Chelatococcus]CAH1661480.1 putative 3-oxo-tetronate kinase YgbK [Hyphomicrobiales bacterium]MBS7741263.1 four-carbon acid sugar kinase family protein [Chelatococcus sp. HY11]MBX3546255.1 four-carbon acid sugar kinase family protein [Chelatococcus sp.]MCO5078086.1 four-carbon acid sugar kinase family protein [Chelatococcus sp.]CAH1683084.1 putative 3-oxo-tetronate kinase YgbK [Hyphomicrobiales bacterium]